MHISADSRRARCARPGAVRRRRGAAARRRRGSQDGHGAATPSCATSALEAFAREHWDVRSVEYRWSAQDPVTLDLLPYVGRLHAAQRPRADGDRLREVGHDGRDGGRAAAGGPVPRARGDVGGPVRPEPPDAAPVAAETRDGERAGRGALRRRPPPPRGRAAARGPGPGEGAIVEHDGERVAAARDEDGTLHAVSARCTHLGCLVRGTTPSAAGTAPATARASPSTAPCSRAPPSTASSASRSGE